MKPFKNSTNLRIIDRVMTFIGSPPAVRHNEAIRAANTAIMVSKEVHTRAEELTDAIRELEHFMDSKR